MSLVVADVSKRYPGRGRGEPAAVACDHVSFAIEPGEAVALVGQSGSGKSTIARMVTGMERQDSGSVTYHGVRVDRLRRKELRRYRGKVQLVFQDPYAALNPLHTVRYVLTRPLVNYHGMTERDAHGRVDELLTTVGLTPVAQFAGKLPHQMSGGQRQRVVIARALAPRPTLLVADEPVSMLDVSLRAGVLELLCELRRTNGVSLLYITHDLLSARLVADRMLVLHEGRVVEQGACVDVLRHPKNDYTRALLDALPTPFTPANG
ncbi:MAG TPA: ATP-binding cassette domain-containing protein, partial [Pseudonocardiaceae bacterium]|nr:ATP-binding cassette domain-containing protein [Pseudonocardiaceae bacterium]